MLYVFISCLLVALLPTSTALARSADTTGRVPGSYVIIGAVTISGNQLTKEFVIRREMNLLPGDTLLTATLAERLSANARRIFNTQLFLSAQVLADSAGASNEVNLRVVVNENWYLWAAPYARLNDRNLNEWVDRGRDLRRLNFGAFADHENLFGRMQKLEFVFETGFTNRFTLRYNIPYLNKGRNLGLFSEFRYQTLANMAYNTIDDQLAFVYQDRVLTRQFDGRLKLRRRQGFYVFHYVDLTYSQTRIDPSVVDLNPYYLRPNRTELDYFGLGYTFRYDRRDNINFSLKGRTFIADIRRMGLLPTDDFGSWQFRLAYGDYYPLGRKWYTNYILKAKVFTNPDIPYHVVRGIGYEEDVLRGYDLYVINGSAFVSGRVNLKRELVRRTYTLGFIKWKHFNTLPLNLYMNVFSDWGYVRNRYTERLHNPLANQWLRSAGVGLEINTWYNTVVRLNVSRNTLRQTNFFVNLQKDIWTRWN